MTVTASDRCNVIVVGYPKSGNTWVTRLVAELLGCPVAGFWAKQSAEIAVEGSDRQSPFACWKAHYPYRKLSRFKEFPAARVINVVRDPRDIAISGAHYFNFPPKSTLLRRIAAAIPGRRKFQGTHFDDTERRVNLMIRALLRGETSGDEKWRRWLSVPWRDHVEAYRDHGTFMIRYEDLLDGPEAECLRILDYLGVTRSQEDVRRAIDRQSFDSARSRFAHLGDARRLKFLREGKKEQWRLGLTRNQKLIFDRELGDCLQRFGYPPGDTDDGVSPTI
jgi:Sulfotransferase domain